MHKCAQAHARHTPPRYLALLLGAFPPTARATAAMPCTAPWGALHGTASGIALLNERAKNRQMMKKVIKSEGFRRLYELCDRTALEYYDDDRIISIGAVNVGQVIYRFADYATYPDGKDEGAYIPIVDVKIHVGDGIANSKAFTVQALSELIKVPVNADNFRLVQSYVEMIGLPMRAQICDALERKYAGKEENAPELSQILKEEMTDE